MRRKQKRWTSAAAHRICQLSDNATTVEEAVEMTKDAIEGVLESLRSRGKSIPEDKNVVVRVAVEA